MNRLFYCFSKTLFWVLFKLFFRLEVMGSHKASAIRNMKGSVTGKGREQTADANHCLR